MAIEVAPLWEFSQPAVSEQRFRTALESATGDGALILLTQSHAPMASGKTSRKRARC